VLDEKKTGSYVQSNMPVLFARFARHKRGGVIPSQARDSSAPMTNATPLGGVGGVDWSIDGQPTAA
jgi:hypothetical protein